MRRRAHVRLRIVVDGRPVGSRTQVHRGTPGLVVCESVVPELGIELRSAYCDGRFSRARVEHLVLTLASVDLETEEHADQGPQVIAGVRVAVLSHLLRLQELLRQTGHNARITPAWPILRLRAFTRGRYPSGLLDD